MAQAPLVSSDVKQDSEKPDSDFDPTCDLCGTKIYQPTLYGRPRLNPSILRSYGSAAKVRVDFTAGEQESDWGAGETISFSLCPQCFEQKLRPWLEGQGATPKVKSWISESSRLILF